MTQTIALGTYKIYIGDIWGTWQTFVQERSYSKLVIIVDENTMRHCFPIFAANTPNMPGGTIQILSGEENKHIGTCQGIWKSMINANIDRNALVVNLGGGVIGDMGGFCASTYKRGIDFVQFPTTLLSQVDASIGGKLGIDFNHIKNSIGVFNDPQAVFIATEFLNTLSAREVRSGFAEIIKHSLIQDVIQWKAIQGIQNAKSVDWSKYLPDSLMIKKRIVEEDPFERGLRKALNFGHTIGHAVESYFLATERPLLHGEAIAIGMICEAYLSHKQVGLSMLELDKICNFILDTYNLISIPKSSFDELLDIMQKDKKNENDNINFSLIPAIGQVKVNQTSQPLEVTESLNFYNKKIERRRYLFA